MHLSLEQDTGTAVAAHRCLNQELLRERGAVRAVAVASVIAGVRVLEMSEVAKACEVPRQWPVWWERSPTGRA